MVKNQYQIGVLTRLRPVTHGYGYKPGRDRVAWVGTSRPNDIGRDDPAEHLYGDWVRFDPDGTRQDNSLTMPEGWLG